MEQQPRARRFAGEGRELPSKQAALGRPDQLKARRAAPRQANSAGRGRAAGSVVWSLTLAAWPASMVSVWWWSWSEGDSES
jgi:hypothetical protein